MTNQQLDFSSEAIIYYSERERSLLEDIHKSSLTHNDKDSYISVLNMSRPILHYYDHYNSLDFPLSSTLSFPQYFESRIPIIYYGRFIIADEMVLDFLKISMRISWCRFWWELIPRSVHSSSVHAVIFNPLFTISYSSTLTIKPGSSLIVSYTILGVRTIYSL